MRVTRPDVASALAALHSLALPLFGAVTYTAALPVLEALITALIDARAWEGVEHLAIAMAIVEHPREGLAIVAELVITRHDDAYPGAVAPLREFARLLRLPVAPPCGCRAADLAAIRATLRDPATTLCAACLSRRHGGCSGPCGCGCDRVVTTTRADEEARYAEIAREVIADVLDRERAKDDAAEGERGCCGEVPS